ncbi:hypothetical protein ABW19_dt0209194 [Dactylella cylindrospora]|nr:hypothetical protein ABW19_dt0209194 [Dactylella cylindrospora]
MDISSSRSRILDRIRILHKREGNGERSAEADDLRPGCFISYRGIVIYMYGSWLAYTMPSIVRWFYITSATSPGDVPPSPPTPFFTSSKPSISLSSQNIRTK